MGKNEIIIRLIKDRERIVVSKLSFKTLHKQVVFNIVYCLVMWLNSFTETQGISDKNSKREIVTRHEMDFTKNPKTAFVEYIESHDDPNINIHINPITHVCIALGTNINIKGTHKVFGIYNGKVL